MTKTKWFSAVKWFASFLSFIGAMLIALNIEETKYAFFIFACSSVIWIYIANSMKEYSLIFLHIGFLMVDVVGLYRWFML
jgi:hypothetical protein